MKAYIFVILCLSCVSFSLAQNLKSSLNNDNSQIISLLQNSKYLQEGASSFQKLLINTIQLKLKTNGQFDQVIELLNELYDDLVQQQNQATVTHNDLNSQWDSDIAQLQSDLDNLGFQLAGDQDALNTANSNIYQGEKTKSNLQAQLDILTSKQADLQAAREADVAAFNQRQSEQQNIVEALSEILTELQNVQASGNPSLIQTNEELIRKLKSIGRTNPISAFVTLTMSFDPDVLQQVIDKLGQIQTSFEQSLIADQEAEVQAQANYDSLMSEFASVAASLQAQLADCQAFLDQNYADQANLEVVIDSINQVIVQKQQVLQDTQTQQQTENAQFAVDSAKRNDEENTVQSVISLLQNNNQ